MSGILIHKGLEFQWATESKDLEGGFCLKPPPSAALKVGTSSPPSRCESGKIEIALIGGWKLELN